MPIARRGVLLGASVPHGSALEEISSDASLLSSGVSEFFSSRVAQLLYASGVWFAGQTMCCCCGTELESF
jgi:hypothetical protein